MPPPRGAGRKGTYPYLNLPVFAESGSHNLDAPLPGAPKMSGGIGFLEHLWGRSPFSVRRGAEAAQRADRGGAHRGILPSFGPQRCVKPYCCLVDCIVFLLGSARCYSTRGPPARSSVKIGLPSLRAHGASFYMLKGLPTGGSVGEGKNGRML